MNLPDRKIKTFSLILIITLSLVIFNVACSQSSDDSEILAPVTISVLTGGKDLQVSFHDYSEDIESYWYTAVPKFSGHCSGAVRTAKKIIPSPSGTANIGLFTQGEWIFTVYGKDASSKVICQGSVTAVLIQGIANTITIKMIPNYSGTSGTLSIDVNIPYLGNEKTELLVKYRKAGDSAYTVLNKDWTSKVENSKVNFQGTGSFDPGSYEISLLYYYNNLQIGGQTVSADILSGEVSTIEGDMEAGINVKSGLNINFETCTSTTAENPLELRAKEQKVFSWFDSSAEGLTYSWYVNGNEVPCNSSSYTFCQSEQGTYTLTCTARINNVVKSAACVINVNDVFQIDFIHLRSGVTGGYMNKGYKKDGKVVSFPLDSVGSESGIDYSTLGLEKDSFNGNMYIALNSVTYLETGTTCNIICDSGKSIFNGSSSNKDWTLKEAVINFDTVPRCCLWYSQALEKLVLTDKVEKVSLAAFANCPSLKEVYIGDISTLSDSTFDGCTSLETVYLKAKSWPADWDLTESTIREMGAEIKFGYAEDFFK